ncbi:NAD(+) diphosphatase [Robbsia sp. Bb-Pol-6]|uniref:NAD(+) diphosphatase n=1 Tax=Robbsia betulipollinis TaxID=2981849 RepID=A0ABT3ZNZ5_9BURK|nr:NAD(+) diphosphatase [Robbsia betulipollinis]MCY0388182.1 NAD(+) diphosphatase [Robbsia betulipollinis]
MPHSDRSSRIGFSSNPLNRLSEKRADSAFIERLRRSPATRFLVFFGERPVLRANDDDGRDGPDGNNVHARRFDAVFTAPEVADLGAPRFELFLGLDAERGDAALFALVFEASEPPSAAGLTAIVGSASSTLPAAFAGLEALDLRAVASAGLVAEALLGELGGAKAVIHWHQRHGFCANCGQPSALTAAGWRRDCRACGLQHFPRVDPVVIMLVIDGERCLLGRQPHFAPGMYSALAGFLEPGETVEDAVRREVREEAGVACVEVGYFASQPWPFPSSLMLGCVARAQGNDLIIDRTELEDARWFSRAEVRAMLERTHPQGLVAPQPFAIAHHLMQAFAAGETLVGG